MIGEERIIRLQRFIDLKSDADRAGNYCFIVAFILLLAAFMTINLEVTNILTILVIIISGLLMVIGLLAWVIKHRYQTQINREYGFPRTHIKFEK